MDILTSVQAELLRAAVAMVAKDEFDHLLYIGDLPLPEDIVKARSNARRKLVQAVTSEAQCQVLQALGIETVTMPSYDIARPARFKMALVAGIAKGLFEEGHVVAGMIGRSPTCYPDTLMVVAIGGGDEATHDTGFGVSGTDRVPSTILESVINLAVEIARDGWEGHPLGTLLVVGDSAVVMEKSRQLTLNPFQGYSETEKNILNPEVRDAIKNFAVLDGAFVIRDDGVVLAAGRYLKFQEDTELEVPLGLGARHMAACGISHDTEAIAVVVSETSGITRVFQNGRSVLEIHPEQRAWRSTTEGGVVAALDPGKEVKATKESKEPKATKEVKAAKEAKEGKGAKEAKAAKEGKEGKATRAAKEGKEVKPAKEPKEGGKSKGAKEGR